jgi:succinate dehydrogenase / fumarate reductase flavoprotein subunit
MQGLADGYFVLPFTVGNYLAGTKLDKVNPGHDAFKTAQEGIQQEVNKLLSIKGNRTVESFHKELGRLTWEYCGMGRNEAGLKKAIEAIPKLREEFWNNVKVPGEATYVNPELEKACRVADFLEQGELMCADALHRKESCGGHFREESQTPEGEAQRDDENFCYVAAWEWQGSNKPQALHKEELKFENVKLATRSYK